MNNSVDVNSFGHNSSYSASLIQGKIDRSRKREKNVCPFVPFSATDLTNGVGKLVEKIIVGATTPAQKDFFG